MGASLGVSGNTEDRSDTWSVDAMASDSEADPMQRNDDILMIDESDTTEVTSGYFSSNGLYFVSFQRVVFFYLISTWFFCTVSFLLC